MGNTRKMSQEEIVRFISAELRKSSAFCVLDIDGVLFGYPYLSVGKETPDFNTWTREDIRENGYLGTRSVPSPKLMELLNNTLTVSQCSRIGVLSTVQTSFEANAKREAIRKYFSGIREENIMFAGENVSKKLVLEAVREIRGYGKIYFFDDDPSNIYKNTDEISYMLCERFVGSSSQTKTEKNPEI